MLSYVQLRALVLGIIHAHSATKQELGRRFAIHLGLEPGPGGPDDGIDGFALCEGRRLHFQCKLRATELDKDEARLYYSDLKVHAVDISVLLAGVGYTQPFMERLFRHPEIADGRIGVHLLTLWDLFGETPLYQAALRDMPRLAGLATLAAAGTGIPAPHEGEGT